MENVQEVTKTEETQQPTPNVKGHWRSHSNGNRVWVKPYVRKGVSGGQG